MQRNINGDLNTVTSKKNLKSSNSIENLFLLIEEGNINKIEEFLSLSDPKETIDATGGVFMRSALSHAVRLGKKEIVELLIKKGAKISTGGLRARYSVLDDAKDHQAIADIIAPLAEKEVNEFFAKNKDKIPSQNPSEKSQIALLAFSLHDYYCNFADKESLTKAHGYSIKAFDLLKVIAQMPVSAALDSTLGPLYWRSYRHWLKIKNPRLMALKFCNLQTLTEKNEYTQLSLTSALHFFQKTSMNGELSTNLLFEREMLLDTIQIMVSNQIYAYVNKDFLAPCVDRLLAITLLDPSPENQLVDEYLTRLFSFFTNLDQKIDLVDHGAIISISKHINHFFENPPIKLNDEALHKIFVTLATQSNLLGKKLAINGIGFSNQDTAQDKIVLNSKSEIGPLVKDEEGAKQFNNLFEFSNYYAKLSENIQNKSLSENNLLKELQQSNEFYIQKIKYFHSAHQQLSKYKELYSEKDVNNYHKDLKKHFNYLYDKDKLPNIPLPIFDYHVYMLILFQMGATNRKLNAAKLEQFHKDFSIQTFMNAFAINPKIDESHLQNFTNSVELFAKIAISHKQRCECILVHGALIEVLDSLYNLSIKSIAEKELLNYFIRLLKVSVDLDVAIIEQSVIGNNKAWIEKDSRINSFALSGRLIQRLHGGMLEYNAGEAKIKSKYESVFGQILSGYRRLVLTLESCNVDYKIEKIVLTNIAHSFNVTGEFEKSAKYANECLRATDRNGYSEKGDAEIMCINFIAAANRLHTYHVYDKTKNKDDIVLMINLIKDLEKSIQYINSTATRVNQTVKDGWYFNLIHFCKFIIKDLCDDNYPEIAFKYMYLLNGLISKDKTIENSYINLINDHFGEILFKSMHQRNLTTPLASCVITPTPLALPNAINTKVAEDVITNSIDLQSALRIMNVAIKDKDFTSKLDEVLPHFFAQFINVNKKEVGNEIICDWLKSIENAANGAKFKLYYLEALTEKLDEVSLAGMLTKKAVETILNIISDCQSYYEADHLVTPRSAPASYHSTLVKLFNILSKSHEKGQLDIAIEFNENALEICEKITPNTDDMCNTRKELRLYANELLLVKVTGLEKIIALGKVKLTQSKADEKEKIDKLVNTNAAALILVYNEIIENLEVLVDLKCADKNTLISTIQKQMEIKLEFSHSLKIHEAIRLYESIEVDLKDPRVSTEEGSNEESSNKQALIEFMDRICKLKESAITRFVDQLHADCELITKLANENLNQAMTLCNKLLSKIENFSHYESINTFVGPLTNLQGQLQDKINLQVVSSEFEVTGKINEKKAARKKNVIKGDRKDETAKVKEKKQEIEEVKNKEKVKNSQAVSNQKEKEDPSTPKLNNIKHKYKVGSKVEGNFIKKGTSTLFPVFVKTDEIKALKQKNSLLYKALKKSVVEGGTCRLFGESGLKHIKGDLWEAKVNLSKSRIFGRTEVSEDGNSYIIFDCFSKNGLH